MPGKEFAAGSIDIRTNKQIFKKLNLSYTWTSSGKHMMKVIRKKPLFFQRWKELVLVEAMNNEEVVIDSLFGRRKWWMEKGDRVVIPIKKSTIIVERDEVSFEYCVREDWKRVNPRIPWHC